MSVVTSTSLIASGNAGDGSERLSGRAAPVDVGGHLERVVAHVQEGVDVGIHGRDAVEVRLRRLDARDLARRRASRRDRRR